MRPGMIKGGTGLRIGGVRTEPVELFRRSVEGVLGALLGEDGPRLSIRVRGSLRGEAGKSRGDVGLRARGELGKGGFWGSGRGDVVGNGRGSGLG